MKVNQSEMPGPGQYQINPDFRKCSEKQVAFGTTEVREQKEKESFKEHRISRTKSNLTTNEN